MKSYNFNSDFRSKVESKSIIVRVRKLARKEKSSMNQFFITAIAEKISAMETEDLLKVMAMRADKKAFLGIIKNVPDVPPIEGDQI